MIHILTGEYPPDPGGVGDYTALIATKLASWGEKVHVWTAGNIRQQRPQPGAEIHRVAGRFGWRGLLRLNRELNATPPTRIIVQWTPHSFGFRSLNVLVPLWLWKRARIDKDRIELMVHEPFLAFASGKWRRNLAALVHRGMMAILLRAASRVFVSIPAWGVALRPWCFGRPLSFEWLPVPSNIDTSADPTSVSHFRASLRRRGRPVVGHFGTFRPDIGILLTTAFKRILDSSDAVILLAGAHSMEFHQRFSVRYPWLRKRFVVTGELPSRALAAFLSACDILLQPYPDGISTRRGTAMAALALGLPVVSNIGPLSEDFWTATEPIAIAASLSPEDLAAAALELAADPERLFAIQKRARELYEMNFDVSHTVRVLLPARAVATPRVSRAVA